MCNYIYFWSEFSIVLYFQTFRVSRVLPFFCGAMLSTYLSKLAQTKHSKTDLMRISSAAWRTLERPCQSAPGGL